MTLADRQIETVDRHHATRDLTKYLPQT